MTVKKMKDLLISIAIILGFLAAWLLVEFKDWQDEVADTKQTCIETHLYANKTDTMVLCGKVATL